MRKVHTHFHCKIRHLVAKCYFDEEITDDAKLVVQWMLDPPQFWKRKFIKKADTQSTKDSAMKSPPRKKGNTPDSSSCDGSKRWYTRYVCPRQTRSYDQGTTRRLVGCV
jgi:hypothetical protein